MSHLAMLGELDAVIDDRKDGKGTRRASEGDRRRASAGLAATRKRSTTKEWKLADIQD